MAQVVRKRDPRALQQLLNLGSEANEQELRVGWFSTNRYPDGTPVAMVAEIHEFGAPRANIPPRPFMRPTIAREENFWAAFVAQELKKIVAGSQTVEGMLEMLGLHASGQVAKSIALVMEPPLKPATIAAKRRKMANKATVGSLDKPLVETGIMLDTVTYTVGKAGAK